jgi:hypothetical protein
MFGGFWQKIVKKCKENSDCDWLTTPGTIFPKLKSITQKNESCQILSTLFTTLHKALKPDGQRTSYAIMMTIPL